MSVSSSSSLPSQRHTTTITVTSRLRMRADESSSPTRHQSSPLKSSKSRYVLTVELDSDNATPFATTRLTMKQLRRTIERVLLPKARDEPPYCLVCASPRQHDARQSSADEGTAQFVSKGDGTVCVRRQRSSQSQQRGQGTTGGSVEYTEEVISENSFRLPAGALVEVFAGGNEGEAADHSDTGHRSHANKNNPPRPQEPPPAKQPQQETPVNSSILSSPKRSAKNVSFIFDEAVVRASEPPRVPHMSSSPSVKAQLRAGSSSSRLPLRRVSDEFPTTTNTTPRMIDDRHAVLSSFTSSSPASHAATTTTMTRTAAITKVLAQPDSCPPAEGERFHRTITPSPLRDEETGSTSSTTDRMTASAASAVRATLPLAAPVSPAHATRKKDMPCVAAQPSLPRQTSISPSSSPSPLSSASASSLPTSSSSTSSLSSPSPSPSMTPRAQGQLPFYSTPCTQTAETAHTATHKTTDNTLPYTESTSAVAEKEEEENMMLGVEQLPIPQSFASASASASSSRSMSSPAFGSFVSASDRTSTVRVGVDSAVRDRTPMAPMATVTTSTTATTTSRRAIVATSRTETVNSTAVPAATRVASPRPSGHEPSTPQAPSQKVLHHATDAVPASSSSARRSSRIQGLLSPLPIETEHDANEADQYDDGRRLRFSESPPNTEGGLSHARRERARYQEKKNTTHSDNAAGETETETEAVGDRDSQGARTARDVLRATERALDKFRNFLPSSPSLTSATDTTRSDTPPPREQPSAALMTQLTALASLWEQHTVLTARQAAQRTRFNAEVAYRVKRHTAHMAALDDFVSAQAETMNRTLTHETHGAEQLATASDRLNTQELAVAQQMRKLQTLFLEARSTLARLRDDLCELPALLHGSTAPPMTRKTKVPLRVADRGRAVAPPSSPPAAASSQAELTALATALVSETAFKQDDIAYLAALCFRGAQQKIALSALENTNGKAKRAGLGVDRTRGGTPALVAVPVCRPALGWPSPASSSSFSSSSSWPALPSSASGLADWLARKPSVVQDALRKVAHFYTTGASRAARMEMDCGYGLSLEDVPGATADRAGAPAASSSARRSRARSAFVKTIHLHDPKQRERRGGPAPRSTAPEALTFPHAYALPLGCTVPGLTSSTDEEEEDEEGGVETNAFAAAVLQLFRTHVMPLLQSGTSITNTTSTVRGRRGVAHGGQNTKQMAFTAPPPRPMKATVLLYGAAGSGKTTCLFGLPPADRADAAGTFAAEKDTTALTSPTQQTEAEETIHFSLSDSEDDSDDNRDNTADKAGGNASSAMSSTMFQFEESSTAFAFETASVGASGPASTPGTMPSPRSLLFHPVTASTPPADVAVGLTPVRAPPTPTATLLASSAHPLPEAVVAELPEAVGADEARLRCGWGRAEGLLPLTLAWLLARCGTTSSSTPSLIESITLSAVEVFYNEVYDLLEAPLEPSTPPPPPPPPPGSKDEPRPEWVFGNELPPARKVTHPSHLKRLTLHRTRALLTGADQLKEDDDAVWTAQARHVPITSREDACHWLQTITDRRCGPPPFSSPVPAAPTTPPPPPPLPSRQAKRNEPEPTAMSAAAEEDTCEHFYSSHVLVTVHVRVRRCDDAETMTEATHAARADGAAPREAAWCPTPRAHPPPPWSPMEETPLRRALGLTRLSSDFLNTPVPASTTVSSTQDAPPRRSRQTDTNTFTLTFADLAGSVRQGAFTPLATTPMAREGALCVRRQLAAVRDVLEAIARASAVHERRDHTPQHYSHGDGFSENDPLRHGEAAPAFSSRAASRATTSGTRAAAAAWDPLRGWSTASPALGSRSVRLTMCLPCAVVAGCPLPVFSSSTAPGASKRASRPGHKSPLALMAVSALTDRPDRGGEAGNTEENFLRALRPWLPRDDDTNANEDDEDESADTESAALPPVRDVPSHVRIPYYRSRLTQLLQPTLGPGPSCRTVALMCINPCSVLEYLPAAVETLTARRKKARAHRRLHGLTNDTAPPLPAVNEETVLAAAQAALEKAAPLIVAETQSTLRFAQHLNRLSGYNGGSDATHTF